MLTVRNPDPISFRSIKYDERAKLQSDIDAFIANGGRVKAVPPGVSGDTKSRGMPIALSTGDSDDSMLGRNRRAAKRARTTQQQSSVLFSGQAAAYIGITPEELERRNAAGDGPPYHTQGRGNARKRYKIGDLDTYMRSRA